MLIFALNVGSLDGLLEKETHAAGRPEDRAAYFLRFAFPLFCPYSFVNEYHVGTTEICADDIVGTDSYSFHRNHFSARVKDIVPQTSRMSIGTVCVQRLAPSRMIARSALLSCVSGKARMNG